VATKEVEWATIVFLEEPQIVEKVLKGEDAKKWEILMQKMLKILFISNSQF